MIEPLTGTLPFPIILDCDLDNTDLPMLPFPISPPPGPSPWSHWTHPLESLQKEVKSESLVLSKQLESTGNMAQLPTLTSSSSMANELTL
jgi:hypothetical protein